MMDATPRIAWVVVVLLLSGNQVQSLFDDHQRHEMQQQVRSMFGHAWDSYVQHAFPGDELKPLSKTATNSLGELGNLDLQHLTDTYRGVALTAIDALSTLAILGNWTEFERMMSWISDHVTFDQDVRVNVFEANIRVLGGLLSGHMLAEKATSESRLTVKYKGELLDVAYAFGRRLLPAFDASPTGLPYAWVNLKTGVRAGEVTESNTAACGTLMLEFGTLSRLTGDARFELAARHALRALWSMRTPRGLFGTSLDISTRTWKHAVGGVGPGSDSFYEYLYKSYVLFGDIEYWNMFTEAYVAALQHYRYQDWYTDAHIYSGQPVHLQFQSLQAFWPGLQAQIGDVQLAAHTFWSFFSLWQAYEALPERWLITEKAIHSTEHYYPLRPELMESAFHLYQATKNEHLLLAGQRMVHDLQQHTFVPGGGYANLRNVIGHDKEDHMSSFFLAETLAYLYLLFDDSFVRNAPFIFTTEGHPIPVNELLQTPVVTDWPLTCAWNTSSSSSQPCHPNVVRWNQANAQHVGKHSSHKKKQRAGKEDVNKGDLNQEDIHMQREAQWASLQPPRFALRQCPLFGKQGVGDSLCHELDVHAEHTCGATSECGRDAVTCRVRRCSQHGFCQAM